MKESPNRDIWVAFPVEEQLRITAFYSMFRRRYGHTYAFPGETHNFWEVVYVIDGSVCVAADDRIYQLTNGEMIIHKPLEVHRFHVTDEGGAELFTFSFSAEGSLCERLKNKVFLLTGGRKHAMEDFLEYLSSVPAETECGRKEHQYLAAAGRIPCHAQILAACVCRLMYLLTSESVIAPASTSPDAIIFNRAVSFLNSNISGQPTVPETAKFCHVSESALKRIFDRYAGISVHKYLLKLKIKAAKTLIEEGESIAAVSERLGFSERSYFSKAFKREAGVSPSELR